jgi:bacillithiol system protein YtxJ
MVLALQVLKGIMQFIPLENASQLEEVKNKDGYSLIFIHNTTCPISKGAHRSLEQDGDQLEGTPVYLIDLMAHGDLSDAVAEQYGIPHQSPQLLLIKDGVCTYDEALSHISASAAAEAMVD